MAKEWTTIRLTSPSSLAVSVAEAKKHLRIATTDVEQDGMIQQLIEAGIDKVQRDTGRQLVTCTYRQDSADFSVAENINYGPVTNVSSVKFLDTDGVEQTLDTSVYTFDAGRQTVKLSYGQEWPEIAEYNSAVKVEYTAGYGADEDCVPRLFKNAVLLLTAQWFFDPSAETYVSDANSNAYERIIKPVMRATYP